MSATLALGGADQPDEVGAGFSDTLTVVISLLRQGLMAIDKNRELATVAISRACELLESQSGTRTGFDAIPGGLAGWQRKRVTAHVDRHLEEAISLAELASVARLSADYFARAFKRTFGVTPHAYVFRRRLEAARDLMVMTELPLCEIALACGFADQAHFTRRFRAEAGAPPRAWRRQAAVPPGAPNRAVAGP